MQSDVRVFLLPGFDGTGHLFNPLIDQLDGYRCTVVSYPDLEHIDDYVRYVDEQIPMEYPIAIIAESFSGPIAIKLLASSQKNFVSAVLSTTFAKPPFPALISLVQKGQLFRLSSPRIERLIVKHLCLNGATDQTIFNEALRVVSTMSKRTISSRLLALSEFNSFQELPFVRVPTLLLRAKQDSILGVSQELSIGISTSKEVIVDGPHLLLQANAIQCAKLIRDHFAS